MPAEVRATHLGLGGVATIWVTHTGRGRLYAIVPGKSLRELGAPVWGASENPRIGLR